MRKTMIVLFLIALLVLSVAAVGCRKRAGEPAVQKPAATKPAVQPAAPAEEPAGVDTTKEPQFEDVDVDLGDVV